MQTCSAARWRSSSLSHRDWDGAGSREEREIPPADILDGFDTLKHHKSLLGASLQPNDYKALMNIMLPGLGLVVQLRTACMFISASSSNNKHSENQSKLIRNEVEIRHPLFVSSPSPMQSVTKITNDITVLLSLNGTDCSSPQV